MKRPRCSPSHSRKAAASARSKPSSKWPAPGGERSRAVACRGGAAEGVDVAGEVGAEAEAVADDAEGRLQALAAQARQLAAQVAACAGVVELAPEQRRQAAACDLALRREHGQQREGAPARQRPLAARRRLSGAARREARGRDRRAWRSRTVHDAFRVEAGSATIVVADGGVVQPVSQHRPGWRLAVIGRSGSFSRPRFSSRSTSSTLLPSG